MQRFKSTVCWLISVQFSSDPWPIESSGHERQESRLSSDPLPVFSAGQGRPRFEAVHQALPLPMTASPNLLGVLKSGFGEAVMTCPNQTSFRLSTVARRWFLWAHKEADHVPHPHSGLVLQVRVADR